MSTYLYIAQIIISATLIVLVILQSKGGNMGRMFGGQDPVFRTRRGVEKVMFQLTIVVIVIFVVMSLANVLLQA